MTHYSKYISILSSKNKNVVTLKEIIPDNIICYTGHSWRAASLKISRAFHLYKSLPLTVKFSKGRVFNETGLIKNFSLKNVHAFWNLSMFLWLVFPCFLNSPTLLHTDMYRKDHCGNILWFTHWFPYMMDSLLDYLVFLLLWTIQTFLYTAGVYLEVSLKQCYSKVESCVSMPVNMRYVTSRW